MVNHQLITCIRQNLINLLVVLIRQTVNYHLVICIRQNSLVVSITLRSNNRLWILIRQSVSNLWSLCIRQWSNNLRVIFIMPGRFIKQKSILKSQLLNSLPHIFIRPNSNNLLVFLKNQFLHYLSGIFSHRLVIIIR